MSDTPIKYDRPFIFHYRGLKRGITVVYNPVTKAFGTAVSGKKDQFCRRMGRTIALGRTVKASTSEYASTPQTVQEVKLLANDIAVHLIKKFRLSGVFNVNA